MLFAILAMAIAAVGLTVHALTVVLVLLQARRGTGTRPGPDAAGGVSIVRTVRDLDPLEEMTLRSSFLIDYPSYEVIFCAQSEHDPAVPLVRRLIAEHPGVPARLLVGDDRVSANPKLNNMVKGWRAAEHPGVVFADSNLLLPRDYLSRLLSAWTPDCGLVSAPPIGSRPGSFWAEVECAMLNTYQARWQYAASSVGFGFAQGKTLMFRRGVVNLGPDLRGLSADLAEDAAATKAVRAAGLKVRLAGPSLFQPLGPRSWRSVLARQRRWAMLRCAAFPRLYALEPLSGAVVPAAALVTGMIMLDGPVAVALAGFAVSWLAAEAALARGAGWHLSRWFPLAWLVRETVMPLIWASAILARDFRWRGNSIATHPALKDRTAP